MTPVRFATFNASLNRFNAGDLAAELATPGSAQPDTIAEIIQRLNSERGVTILLVEQNARMALDIADFGYDIPLSMRRVGGSNPDDSAASRTELVTRRRGHTRYERSLELFSTSSDGAEVIAELRSRRKTAVPADPLTQKGTGSARSVH